MSENQNAPIYITIVRDLLDIVLPNSAFSSAGYSLLVSVPVATGIDGLDDGMRKRATKNFGFEKPGKLEIASKLGWSRYLFYSLNSLR